jgi:hypothetical protein
VAHVGRFVELEQEMTEWDPAGGGPSPNRLDALVWGAFELADLEDALERDPDMAAGLRELNADAPAQRWAVDTGEEQRRVGAGDKRYERSDTFAEAFIADSSGGRFL